MIRGIGIDVVEVDRIERLYRKYGDKFLKKVYTEEEISYCMNKANRFECLAGRFSAKEAVVKATGGRVGIYKEIEIINGEYGPIVKIRGEFFCNMLVSITHIKGLAMAMAIWEDCDETRNT